MDLTRRSFVNIFATTALAATATSFLGACNREDSGAKSASGESPSGQADASGLPFRLSAGNVPSIDPGVANDGASGIAMINLYDALVYSNSEKEIIPWLATEWETSEDGLKWTFKLRPDVKFHNGDPVTASDVVYSLERLLTLGTGPAFVFAGRVDKAEVVDDSTVVFTLAQPFGPFLAALQKLYIVNSNELKANYVSGEYGDEQDYGSDYLLTHDAGSGPYTVTELIAQEYVTAVKFEDYWNGWKEGAPASIQIFNLSSEPATVRTLIANKELEQTDWWLSAESVEELEKIEGVKISYLVGMGNEIIMLNTKKAPTDDIHFRKALSYALDYDTALESIFAGSTRSLSPVVASTPGFAAGLPQYTFDIDKAKAELAQSKYADQLADYPIEISWGLGSEDHEKLAILFQSNIAELGITATLSPVEWGAFQAQVTTIEGTPQAVVMANGGSYDEAAAEFQSRYHSNGVGFWSQTEWLQDPQIDQQIDEALQTTDQTERFAQYKKIQEAIVELAPTIWVADLAHRIAYRAESVTWPYADAQEKNESFAKGRIFYYPDYKVV
jgi:peptide/nickel transport system substrate-binding protein